MAVQRVRATYRPAVGTAGVHNRASAMISGRGGTNGKPVWSGPAFEERTRTSTEGSRLHGCGTCGFGKLEVRRPGAQATANNVGGSTAEDRGSPKSALGEVEGGAEESGIAGSGLATRENGDPALSFAFWSERKRRTRHRCAGLEFNGKTAEC